MKTRYKLYTLLILVAFALKVYGGMEWGSWINGIAIGWMSYMWFAYLQGDKNA